MEQLIPYENQNSMVSVVDNDIMTTDVNSLMAIAEQAERRVAALNKMMNAAIKITSGLDWTVIGGKPYLQETGATKVARLFGISWRIAEGYPKQTIDNNGYPTWEYRMIFTMGNNSIECDGSRDGSGDFFTGKTENKKNADEINTANVKKSAYTNCLNNGIKRLLPGLRNIDLAVLEAQGIKPGSGYTFKTGSKGGNSGKAADSGLVCEYCGTAIPQNVASFSQGKYNKKLCMKCQKNPAAIAPPMDDNDALPPPIEPPMR